MVRIVLVVIAGFFAWFVIWVGIEKILSAAWPAFGAFQAAFQEAIERGPRSPDFFPDTTFLIVHVLVACIVSAAAGFLAASVADEKARAPLALGFMLLAMGLAKAYMSWPLVPLWYHVIFAAILLPMAILGGRFYSSN